jgi:hypothetical protein
VLDRTLTSINTEGNDKFIPQTRLNKLTVLSSSHFTDIRHPEELSLLKKPRDPTKKKKKKLDDQSEDEALELEGPLIMPGSGEN